MSASRKPADTPFKQQKLKAWQPILTPKWVIATFMVVAVAFIPIGATVLSASNQIKEKTLEYASSCDNNTAPTRCVKSFELDEDWDPPIYVYYQLKNFYQNHRRYVQSRADAQLRGAFSGNGEGEPDTLGSAQSDAALCAPEIDKKWDDKKLVYYPCGLVALSWFNDTFKLRANSTLIQWNDKTGLAWSSDVDEKFKSKSTTWLRKNCNRLGPLNGDVNEFNLTGFPEELRDFARTGNPNGNYNCWHYVEDQKFIVWMRTAGLPNFKKLYAKIDHKLTKGTYSVEIDYRFPVLDFDGEKAFVLSTTAWIGGKNDFLGIAYIIVGTLCFAMAIIFLIKHLVSPRTLGDVRYLKW